MNRNFRRARRKDDQVLITLPFWMELVLVTIVPVVAAFSIWKVVDEISGKAAVLSQAIGYPIDFWPSLFALREPLFLVSAFTGVLAYLKARHWLRRKMSLV